MQNNTYNLCVCEKITRLELTLLFPSFLSGAVVIKRSNAQIPVNGRGLLLQMINFALVTKVDI